LCPAWRDQAAGGAEETAGPRWRRSSTWLAASPWMLTITSTSPGNGPTTSKTGVIDLFAGNVARNYAVDAEGKMPSTGVGLEDWGAIWLGGYHGDGGPAKGAGFLHPEHLAFDSKGDMYVCDNSNNRVRKIDMTTGIITTVIGTGKPTSAGDGGPATQAGTLMPDAICLDAHDNLYLGEKYGYRVRKVDAKTGIVTTLVGNGVPGWGEEAILASKATVNSVEAGIYADPNGDVYWSDCSRRVRKYEARTGLVTTFLGGTSIHDGEVATNGFLCAPKGIAVGPDGQIYFADMFNQRVRGIDPATGIIRTVAGNGARAYGGDDGPATEAYLSNPTDVSVDSKGRLVIADSRHGLVRMVDEGGIMRGVAGTGFQWDKGDGGPARSANMLSVSAVAHGPNDDIYLCDGTSGRVRRIDARTGTIDTVAGTGRPGYSGDGGPARSAQIGWVSAIRFDGAGNMYLADTSNHAVRKVDAGGVISTVIGAGHAGFSPDGTRASEALLNSPSGLAVTKQGTMYVSDTRNNRVRKVGPDGRIVTVAGTGEPGDSGDGDDAARAELMEPHGLCLYGDDVLLVSDYFNSRVRAVRL